MIEVKFKDNDGRFTTYIADFKRYLVLVGHAAEQRDSARRLSTEVRQCQFAAIGLYGFEKTLMASA